MKTNTIITIGRQYGSGGKEIGRQGNACACSKRKWYL